MDIADEDVEGLARNGVVTTGPELTGNASVHHSLSSGLSGDGDAQNHPCELEAPSDHIQVPNREDEGDDGDIGDRRGACRDLSVPESCPWCSARIRLAQEARVGSGTYEGCSTRGARRRRNGSGSEVDRLRRDCWVSGGKRRGWRARQKSSGAVRGPCLQRGLWYVRC